MIQVQADQSQLTFPKGGPASFVRLQFRGLVCCAGGCRLIKNLRCLTCLCDPEDQERCIVSRTGEYSKTRVPTKGRRHHSSWRTSEIVIQLETPSLTNVLDPCLPMWT